MGATTAGDDQIMSMQEAADYIGIDMVQLYKLNASGLPHHKPGKRVRYLRSELDAWLRDERSS